MKDARLYNVPLQLVISFSSCRRRCRRRFLTLVRPPFFRSTSLALLWLVLGFSGGCGRSGDLPTAKAGGVVTIDDQSLANAHVIFTPEKGRAAMGQTGADGRFTLTTYRSGDGAIVGHHHVTVVAREPSDGQTNTPGAPGIERPGRSLIPEKYGSTATSGLEFDVVEGRENSFQIQITSAHP
jgi:hypothetical protein